MFSSKIEDMYWNSLNEESLRRINNIVVNFKNHPAYARYSINSYCRDWKQGIHAIEVGLNGNLINLWLFFPGPDGEIQSIAVYGSHLLGHLNAIRQTMKVFGMEVESAELDRGGMSDYVDIFLKPY